MTHARRGIVAPVPLLLVFAAFLAAIIYLVAASLTRRTAPAYSPSSPSRVRAADWQRAGDTITIDATDGDHWRYVSLARGIVLRDSDSAAGDLAVQRYRVITPPGGALADLGVTTFDRARATAATAFMPTTAGDHPTNSVIEHWYRYNLLTHLLEPNGHIYALRSPTGALWKLAVISYYCPGVQAGCLTVRYAPMPASPSR